MLGWQPKWSAERAVEETVAWTKARVSGRDMMQFTQQQIQTFFDKT